MKTTLFSIYFLVLAATAAVMAQAPSVKVTTDAWVVEYDKDVIPLSDTETWSQETVSLGRKEGACVYFDIDMAFSPEMQLFFFTHEKCVSHGEDENYCSLILGLDVKKKLEAMFFNPTFLQAILKGELKDAAEEYLKKAPGNSLDDEEWEQIAARVEAAVKAEFEAEMKSFVLQTIVIDASAENEIALPGGVAPWLYPKVAEPEKLRRFMASMQTLAKTAIRELKESQKLSESTQKQLDALVGLMPEQYGMTK